jgi:hypothetical protein
MALTPISLFQSQGSGIAQFLQGGQNALASALNNVIQVGRDTVNKQFAQERDFLGERQRVEALAQRRGENLQQQANLDRSFARSMFESDRQFADTNADQARQEARMNAVDLFNQRESNRNFDLRKSEADRIAEERRRQEEFNRGLLSQPPAGAPGDRPELSADYLFGPVAGTPAPAPRTGVMGEAPEAGMATAPSLEARIADAQTRMQAAKNIGDAKAYTEAQGNLTAAQAELRQAGGGVAAPTTREERAAITFQQGQEDRQRRIQKDEAAEAEKAAKTERGKATSQAQILVEANADAFPPAGAAIPEGLSKEEQEAAMAQAKATDANRVAVELQAALDSPTFEDYLAKMVPSAKKEGDTWVEKTPEDRLAEAQRLPKSVKDKRRKLWNLARKTGLGDSETPPAGAPTVETPSTASEVSRLLGKRQALTE